MFYWITHSFPASQAAQAQQPPAHLAPAAMATQQNAVSLNAQPKSEAPPGTITQNGTAAVTTNGPSSQDEQDMDTSTKEEEKKVEEAKNKVRMIQ